MSVVDEIAAERRRQIEAEGWSAAHDDKHDTGQMATAAGWYALNADHHNWTDTIDVSDPRHLAYDIWLPCPVSREPSALAWPWSREWWKPKDARSDLIRAAALIVAEIERLDRVAARKAE